MVSTVPVPPGYTVPLESTYPTFCVPPRMVVTVPLPPSLMFIVSPSFIVSMVESGGTVYSAAWAVP